jgi:MFS family permease
MMSHALSATGQTLGTVAVTVVVFERTRSTAWVAAAATSRLLPYVLFSSVAGVLADRLPRWWILVASNAVRVVLTGVLAVLALAGAPALAIVAVAFLATTAGTPAYPVLAATMPLVVPDDVLAPANGVLTTIETAAFIVGPAIGGAVLAVGTPAIALWVNSGVFLVSIGVLARVGPLPEPVAAGAGSGRAAWMAGVRTISDTGDLAAPLLLVVLINLLYGVSLVILLPVATDLLHAGRGGYGFLNTALGVGALGGVVVSNRLASGPARRRFLALAVLTTAVPFAVLPIARQATVAALLIAVSGAGSTVTEILAVTLIQRAVPAQVAARVFGLLDSLVVGAILVGSWTAPIALRLVGLSPALVLFGGLLPAGTILATNQLLAVGRQAEDRRRHLAPLIELLSRLPVLASAGPIALEALARTATDEEIGPGVDVVQEGVEADDFFVVRSGRLEVMQAAPSGAHTLRVLTAGDGFGELGLLRAAPRSATVRTLEICQLARIRGADFLGAVNGAAPVAAASPGGARRAEASRGRRPDAATGEARNA